MLSNNQNQPKCLKCGKPLNEVTCSNCGFNVMRESLLTVDKSGQDKVFYKNEFAYFKENNFDYCYQTGLKYSEDKIFFGSYYQNNQYKKEPIEWQILEKKGNRALLISKYALDCKGYHELLTDTTWEKCTLRVWLNEAFLKQAFTPEEQSMIAETTVKAHANPKHITNPGNDTVDKVFLLSIPEINRYFKSDEERICQQTKYCFDRGAYDFDGHVWWWLRSPGGRADFAALVGYGGSVLDYGNGVNNDISAVRPALWVNLES